MSQNSTYLMRSLEAITTLMSGKKPENNIYKAGERETRQSLN